MLKHRGWRIAVTLISAWCLVAVVSAVAVWALDLQYDSGANIVWLVYVVTIFPVQAALSPLTEMLSDRAIIVLSVVLYACGGLLCAVRLWRIKAGVSHGVPQN